MDNINLITIFFTGLLVGGLTCMAVQGGLLAATIAQRFSKDEAVGQELKSGKVGAILAFLIAKIVAYGILGFLLGWLGSVVQLSLTAKIVMQVVVVIFMVGTALNLLDVHPIFRYFIIQPPRFLTRFIRKESKSSSMFAPAMLGALTVFVPCGTTQAMMALAIASGNPLLGATIMLVFTIGTSPVFFTLGYLATRLGEALQQRFMKIAAYAVLLLALYNLNGTIALTGSRVTLETLATDAYCVFAFCNDVQTSVAAVPVSDATITIDNNGYSPSNLTVKAGSQVTLHLTNKSGGGCAQALTIPSLNLQKIVPVGKSDTLTFTAPNTPGTQIAFMCSMGMYRGTINVI